MANHPTGIKVFVDVTGQVHVVPAHLLAVRITAKGWPDKRSKSYAAYMAWVAEVSNG